MKKTIAIAVAVSLGFQAAFSAEAQQPRGGQMGLYGIALPKRQVTMRSSIESQIQSLNVDEGQFVKKGDVLVVLDCRAALVRKTIAQLEAAAVGVLNSAQAELEYAESHLNRISKLVNDDATTLREYEDANLRLKRARAALKIEQEAMSARQARFDLAEAELQQYYLRAPFDGQVVQISSTQGESVTQTDDLLQLVSLDHIRVEMFLPLELADKLVVNRRYRMRIDSPVLQFADGLAVFRSPIVDAATGTIRYVFEIDNRQHQIPAGATVVLDDTNIILGRP